MMSLVNKIKELYPELANDSFDGRSGIIIKDDLDGYGAYISEWNHETLAMPTQAQIPTLRNYHIAFQRLSKHVLADGREEQTEEFVIGQEWNEETEEMVDVTETRVTASAIEPVEATVEHTTYDEEGNAVTVTVDNPLITADNEERAAAQATVDATPQEVIDAYNAL